jgi:hypothetical protein
VDPNASSKLLEFLAQTMKISGKYINHKRDDSSDTLNVLRTWGDSQGIFLPNGYVKCSSAKGRGSTFNASMLRRASTLKNEVIADLKSDKITFKNNFMNANDFSSLSPSAFVSRNGKRRPSLVALTENVENAMTGKHKIQVIPSPAELMENDTLEHYVEEYELNNIPLSRQASMQENHATLVEYSHAFESSETILESELTLQSTASSFQSIKSHTRENSFSLGEDIGLASGDPEKRSTDQKSYIDQTKVTEKTESFSAIEEHVKKSCKLPQTRTLQTSDSSPALTRIHSILQVLQGESHDPEFSLARIERAFSSALEEVLQEQSSEITRRFLCNLQGQKD